MNSNFYLTKRALLDIKYIFKYTFDNWSENQAKQYIKELYSSFQKLAATQDLGNLRKYRCEPFLMYPANKHYVIYEPFNDGIIIITITNQVRNIENIVIEFGSTFQNEIEELKNNL